MQPQYREKLTTDAVEYFDQLIDDILHAKSSIDVETYIFDPDVIGKRVVDALCHVSQRGVQCRVLIDGFGSHPWLGSQIRRLESAGVSVRIFHPMPWRFWQWRRATTKRYWFDRFLFFVGMLNRRNHRKMCIIDDKLVWIGSFNISVSHLPSDSGGKDWRDTAVRVETNDVEDINLAFQKNWGAELVIPIQRFKTKKIVYRLNNSLKRRRFLNKDLLRHIALSQQRIWITNPYFIPAPKLLRRLKRAASRRIHVRLMVPGTSDIFFMPWATSMFYPSLLNNGVKIFEYNDGILHAKTLIIDDWMTVGSSNLNSRSLLHDLEVDYVLQTQEAMKALENDYIMDMELSTSITREDIPHKFWLAKVMGKLVLMLRYWI